MVNKFEKFFPGPKRFGRFEKRAPEWLKSDCQKYFQWLCVKLWNSERGYPSGTAV